MGKNQKETPNEIAETDAKIDRAGSKEDNTADRLSDPAIDALSNLRDDVDSDPAH